jgi:DNA transposition AAA+ family ATPase
LQDGKEKLEEEKLSFRGLTGISGMIGNLGISFGVIGNIRKVLPLMRQRIYMGILYRRGIYACATGME